MEQYRQLTGTITQKQRITGRIELNNAISGIIALREVLTGIIQLPNLSPPIYPIYDGEYNVTPHFYEQTLGTKEKLATDDVTVEVIPAHEVTNPAGGLTVTIG